MQNEIVALIESLTKQRDNLNAAIGALSRVRIAETRRLVNTPPRFARSQAQAQEMDARAPRQVHCIDGREAGEGEWRYCWRRADGDSGADDFVTTFLRWIQHYAEGK